MSQTTTLRSRRLMEGRGFHVEQAEHYNAFTQRRHDLFGFVDLLCVHKETGEIVAVQSTSASNVSSRVNKITDSPLLPIVRKAGIGIAVHGWAKKGHRWQCREEDIS